MILNILSGIHNQKETLKKEISKVKKKVKIGILIDRNDIDFFSFEIIDWLKK